LQAFAGKTGLAISCNHSHSRLLQEKLDWRFPANPSHSRLLQEKLAGRFPANWFHSRILQEKSHIILLCYLSLHRNVAI